MDYLFCSLTRVHYSFFFFFCRRFRLSNRVFEHNLW
uniref:Uncharacterized protein n=1 Tax=Arundo donax TaxID=35708 RepID=A0A0A9E7C4_ARUDO